MPRYSNKVLRALDSKPVSISAPSLLAGCPPVAVACHVLGCGLARVRACSTLGAVTGDLGSFDLGDLIAAPLAEVDVIAEVSATELGRVEALLLLRSREHQRGTHAQEGVGAAFGVGE
jgi:hypothetical protein